MSQDDITQAAMGRFYAESAGSPIQPVAPLISCAHEAKRIYIRIGMAIAQLKGCGLGDALAHDNQVALHAIKIRHPWHIRPDFKLKTGKQVHAGCVVPKNKS